ncbi:MAG: hypothetical protein PHD76_12590 [Methylacidiphilales bacterium]|nr:hypothetical protein [Candidatus Methylacidiphilales bacterium]
MKKFYSPYSILAGSIIGFVLAFTFYAITGLKNPGFFADVSLLRKIADGICIVAFMSLGTQIADIIFRLITPKQKE